MPVHSSGAYSHISLLVLDRESQGENTGTVEHQLVKHFAEAVFHDTRDQDRSWWRRESTMQVMDWGELTRASEAADAIVERHAPFDPADESVRCMSKTLTPSG